MCSFCALKQSKGKAGGAQICVCDKEVGKDRARPTRVEEYASEFSLRFSLSARPGASQLEQKTWRLVDATNSTRFGPQSDEAEPTQLINEANAVTVCVDKHVLESICLAQAAFQQ